MKKLLINILILLASTIGASEHDVKSNGEKAICNSLIQAVIESNFEQVTREIAQKNADINAQDKEGMTALHWAVAQGNKEIVALLLEAPTIDVNIQNNDGFTPLALASMQGMRDIVDLLLKHKADITTRSFKGKKRILDSAYARYKTLAHKATQENCDSIKELEEEESHSFELLRKKAGLTPFMLASQAGHSSIIKALLAFGANPLDESVAIDKFNRPAFGETGHPKSIAAVDVARRKVKPYVSDIAKQWNARSQEFIQAAAKGDNDQLLALHKKGIYVNARDTMGYTALSHAVSKGHIKTVELLTKLGADPNEIDDRHQNTLMHAVHRGHTPVVKLLIESGAFINKVDAQGEAPLIIAARAGFDSIVELLINKGARINTSDLAGFTPLMAAANKGHSAVVKLLLNAGAKIDTITSDGSKRTALLMAALKGHTEVVQQLIHAGADIFATDSWGSSAELLAASQGNAETAEMIKNAKKEKLGQLDSIFLTSEEFALTF